MRNYDLVLNFLAGATTGKGSNLYIDDNKLINYSTCIAFRKDSRTIVLNGQRYSQTTSIHQNRIRRNTVGSQLIEIDTEEDFYHYIRNC